eukprot:4930762-Ditylum_brightwellii.AAC.1
MMHQEHAISGEGGMVGVGEVMVRQKSESWVATGDQHFCPLKPMQWLQRAQVPPLYTKEGRLVGTYLEGGVAGATNKMFFLLSPPPSFLSFL